MSGAGVRVGEVTAPALSPAQAAIDLNLAQADFDSALSEWWTYSPEQFATLAVNLWKALKTLRDAIAGES